MNEAARKSLTQYFFVLLKKIDTSDTEVASEKKLLPD